MDKNLAFQDPPSLKFHNRTDINLGITPSLLPILLNGVISLYIDPYSTVPNNLKDGVPPQGLSDRLTCEAHKAKFVNIVMD